jgi:hypothetical protein
LKFSQIYTIISWLPELIVKRAKVEGCANKLHNPSDFY